MPICLVVTQNNFKITNIGTFNLNNVSIEILSPLREFFYTVDHLDPKVKRPAIEILAPIVQQVLKRHNPDKSNDGNLLGMPSVTVR
jgi:hypothetical protein